MSADVVYEIARYDVGESQEVLRERAQVFRTDGSLSWRLGSGPANAAADFVPLIRHEAALNEIRANQVTRITAASEFVDELPLLLVSPGDRNEFDEDAWSDELLDEHIHQEWSRQTGLHRVLYVNGDRWCPWPTPDGDRLLPESLPTVLFESQWAELSFIETGSMVSGVDKTVLGLVNPSVVASATEPDQGIGHDEQDVWVWRRDGSVANDARIFLDWLLDNPLERFWGLSMGSSCRGCSSRRRSPSAMVIRCGARSWPRARNTSRILAARPVRSGVWS